MENLIHCDLSSIFHHLCKGCSSLTLPEKSHVTFYHLKSESRIKMYASTIYDEDLRFYKCFCVDKIHLVEVL